MSEISSPSSSSSSQRNSPVSSSPRKLKQCKIWNKIRDMWDELFIYAKDHGADVYLIAEDDRQVPAHFFVLSQTSPIWEKRIMDSMPDNNGIRHIKMDPSVPVGALWLFIRYLYSSCYAEADLEEYVLDLLALSISYAIPSLQHICLRCLELNTKNVIEKLQLSRSRNESKLSTICMAFAFIHFDAVKSTEGWTTMCSKDPILKQELLELSKYWFMHDVLEALVHRSEVNCSTTAQAECGFRRCKELEKSSQHFNSCEIKAAGGCDRCRQVEMSLRLHSRMCCSGGSCKVPLCSSFKEQVSDNQRMNYRREDKLDEWVRGLNKVRSLFSALL